ncbi:MAG: amino acid ABC transporter permease [Pseudonocardia sp.]|nr:amino acid ABC transporter permease [Pseudonocardia sp.]
MNAVTDNLGLFGTGVLTTLQISLIAGVGAFVLGTIMAGFRVSPAPPLQWVGSAWVTVLRNTPLSVVLFTIAFGLPEIGVNASFFAFGVTGLALYTSAFVCEAIRSGINSVSAGQAEAARSVGLTFSQTLSLVVLPQAFRTVVPPLGNVFIAMLKNSAIVGAVGVGGELFSLGVQLTGAGGLATIPVFTGVALGYLVLTIPAGLLLGLLERKAAIAR